MSDTDQQVTDQSAAPLVNDMQENSTPDNGSTQDRDMPTNTPSGVEGINNVMKSVNSYLNFIKPFSGESVKEQSVGCFFDTLEDLASLAQWPPNIIHFILRSKLTGKAAVFYETNLKTLRGRPIGDIRLRFERRFATRIESDPWKEILSCKQALGEIVEDYASRLYDLREKCNSNGSDSFIGMNKLLALFLEGLSASIKEHMITVCPKSFAEAVDMATHIETKLFKINPKRGSAMMATAIDEPISEMDSLAQSVSTLAVGRQRLDTEPGKDIIPSRDQEQRTARPTGRFPTWEDRPKKGKNKQKNTKMKQKKDKPDDKQCNFRDTSGTTMAELNKQFGGTKHVISIYIGGESIQCLVDPASDYSIISESSVRALGYLSNIYKGERSSIAGALGGLIDSESCVDLIFKINESGDRYKHTFRVATSRQILGYAAILGMDFLLPNQARMDYVSGTLYLWNKVVTHMTPTSKFLSTSSLLEVVCKGSSENSGSEDNGENKVILVQYAPDGSWRHISEIIEERVQKSSSATLVCSANPKSRNRWDGAIVRDTTTRDRVSDSKSAAKGNDHFLDIIREETHATGEDLNKLLLLITKHKGLLQNTDSKLRILHNFSHAVELTDYTPIKRPQYQIPVALRSDLKIKLKEYLDNDILEPSTSPWNIPLIVKRKKTGELRLILDATAINKVTKKIDYPIVRIEDTFHRLSNKLWFSNIDLKNGYHQIQLDTQSRKLYAFKTPFGKHQFKRMPMGASNSGLFFQRVMEKILAPLNPENIVIYQDDILIATNTVKEHLEILDKLFEIFSRENVQINCEKSKFLVKEVAFLGHNLSRGSFSPSKENIIAIGLLKPPQTKKQLRGVLGKVNFYGRLIPSLSQVALPLTNLLSKKKKDISWGPVEEEAFVKLKKALCSSPLLHYPDFTRKFCVSIQVSDAAIVSALEQEFDSGRWPIAFFSKKLNTPQKNYSIIEKHALAVVTVLEYFHHIIHGYEVDVITDRKAIEYLRCLKDGSTRTTNWINLAAKYSPNYTFEHEKTSLTRLLDIRDECQEENSPNIDNTPCDSIRVPETIPKKENTDSSMEGITTSKMELVSIPAGKSKCNEDSPPATRNLILTDTSERAIGEENFPIAYTDGSCSKNGTPSAIAGIGVCWKNDFLPEFYGPCIGTLSNNKAELQAVIKAISLALEAKAPGIVIHTDSSYVVTNVTVNKALWKTRGWLSAKGKPIENLSYFQEIDKLEDKLDIRWVHVKGHSGHPGNDRAHSLAIKGCEMAEQVALLAASPTQPENTVTQSLAIRATPAIVAADVSEREILDLQMNDEECLRISGENSTDEPHSWTHGIKCYMDGKRNLHAKGIIEISPRHSKRVNCIYVPEPCREKVLNFIHLNKWSCHVNYINMCHTLLEKYYWSTFRVDIKQYLDNCLECQKMNSTRKKPIVLDFPKPKHPGEKIALDIIGPIITANGGEKYILTIIDLCSRYLTLCPLKDMTTIEVVKAMEKYYVAIFGTPTTILTDRGGNFRSKIFEEACNLMKVKHHFTAPYRPSTNGMVERANKEVKRKLVLLCNHAGKTWSEKLYLVQFSHNNSWHSGINSTPNKMIFGRNMSFPGWDLRNDMVVQGEDTSQFLVELRNRLDFVRTLAYEHEISVRNKRNNQINKKRYIPSLKVGDLVMYRSVKRGKTRNHGFHFLYSGPYTVVKKVSEVSYDIQLPDDISGQTGIIRTHAERLKPYVHATDSSGHDTSGRTPSSFCPMDKSLDEQNTTLGHDSSTSPVTKPTPIEYVDGTDKELSANKNDVDNTEQTTPKGRYFTRSKGKVDEAMLKNIVIKRGRVIQ